MLQGGVAILEGRLLTQRDCSGLEKCADRNSKSCSVAQCEERLGQLSLFRGSWERGRVVSVCEHA